MLTSLPCTDTQVHDGQHVTGAADEGRAAATHGQAAAGIQQPGTQLEPPGELEVAASSMKLQHQAGRAACPISNWSQTLPVELPCMLVMCLA